MKKYMETLKEKLNILFIIIHKKNNIHFFLDDLTSSFLVI